MKFVFVDTNYLRSPKLLARLESTNDSFVISEESSLEMFKNQPFITVKKSTDIVRLFADRFSVAREYHDLLATDPYSDLKNWVMAESQAILTFFFTVGRSDPSYRETRQITALSRVANEKINELVRFNSFMDWTGTLTLEDMRAIREGALTEHTVQIMKVGCANTARNLLRDKHITLQIYNPSDVTRLMAFRFPMAKMIAGFRWTAHGKTVKHRNKVQNDAIDMNMVLMASMFDEFLTDDVQCRKTYDLMVKALKMVSDQIDRDLTPNAPRQLPSVLSKFGIERGLSSDRVLSILASPFDRWKGSLQSE